MREVVVRHDREDTVTVQHPVHQDLGHELRFFDVVYYVLEGRVTLVCTGWTVIWFISVDIIPTALINISV